MYTGGSVASDAIQLITTGRRISLCPVLAALVQATARPKDMQRRAHGF